MKKSEHKGLFSEYEIVDNTDEELDEIIEAFERITLLYGRSRNACNAVYFEQENATIVLDFTYWEIYEQYLQGTLWQKDTNIACKSTICLLANYLSDKYRNISNINMFLLQIDQEFHIDVSITDEQKIFSTLLLRIGKVFSLYHEIGHILYLDNHEKLQIKKKYVLAMLAALEKDDFEPTGKWQEISWESVSDILSGKNEVLLEEITCDAFAAEETAHWCYNEYNVLPYDCAQSIVVAIEQIMSFQGMFNAIITAWNNHYPEMRYQVKIRHYEPNDDINKLAIGRNQLGSMLQVALIGNLFSLSSEERKKLWDVYDHYHVNNQPVVDCLADDDFIVTAIMESRL